MKIFIVALLLAIGYAQTVKEEDTDDSQKWNLIGLAVSVSLLLVAAVILYMKEFYWCPHDDEVYHSPPGVVYEGNEGNMGETAGIPTGRISVEIDNMKKQDPTITIGAGSSPNSSRPVISGEGDSTNPEFICNDLFQIFDSLDTDNNRSINQKDLIPLFGSEEKAEEILKKYDKNNSGSLTVYEFRHYYIENPEADMSRDLNHLKQIRE